MDGDDVAFFRALDGDRAALRVEEGEVQQGRRAVVLRPQLAVESIDGFDGDNVSGRDPQDRFGIRTIDIVEVALVGERELMCRTRPALRHPAPRHVRCLLPAHCHVSSCHGRRRASPISAMGMRCSIRCAAIGRWCPHGAPPSPRRWTRDAMVTMRRAAAGLRCAVQNRAPVVCRPCHGAAITKGRRPTSDRHETTPE